MPQTQAEPDSELTVRVGRSRWKHGDTGARETFQVGYNRSRGSVPAVTRPGTRIELRFP